MQVEKVDKLQVNLLYYFDGDECVVYNSLSGDTYLLPSKNAQLLQLVNQPSPRTALINKATELLDMSQTEAEEHLAYLFGNYFNMGLINTRWV